MKTIKIIIFLASVFIVQTNQLVAQCYPVQNKNISFSGVTACEGTGNVIIKALTVVGFNTTYNPSCLNDIYKVRTTFYKGLPGSGLIVGTDIQGGTTTISNGGGSLVSYTANFAIVASLANAGPYYATSTLEIYNGSTYSSVINVGTSNYSNVNITPALQSSSISINNIATPLAGNLPATILRCSSGNALNLIFPAGGTSHGYTIEKGVYSGGNFTALGGTANTFTKAVVSGTVPTIVNLLASPISGLRLSEWSGFVRVTATFSGPCNTLTNVVKIYNLDGNVEFTQAKCFGASNTTIAASRYTDINFTNNLTGTFSSVQYNLPGWMGQKSCGIDITSNLSGITSSTITVERIVGATTGVLFTLTKNNGIIGNCLFNEVNDYPVSNPSVYSISYGTSPIIMNASNAANWFRNTAIAGTGNNKFKITVVATNSSGTCSSVAYFGLLSGPGSTTWRQPQGSDNNNDIEMSMDNLLIYPNPVSDNLNFYLNQVIIDKNGYILDISGSIIKQIPLVSGNNNVDITKLKSGIYFLKCNNLNGINNYKFVKL